MDALYEELQEDLGRLAEPLFGFAVDQVQKNGQFLPVGAILNGSGEVGLIAGSTGEELVSSTEVLPVLHEALRQAVQPDGQAAAACEWVTITPEAGKPTQAIKVLVEHARGLTVAFYLPMQKRALRGWKPGEVFAISAEPEVGAFESHSGV